jgi:hypothetical protein
MNLPKALKMLKMTPKRYTTKYFLKSKAYVVSLVISVVSKNGFGIFLAHLVCLKFEK